MSQAEINNWDAEQAVAQLDALAEELEQYPDPELREKALDFIQLTLELYGEALRRIVQSLRETPQTDQTLGRLAQDEVVRAVLLIHGLVPVKLEDRVAAALTSLRTYLIAQGCDVQLLGVEDGRARMRLIRSGRGAPPVAALKTEIEQALAEAAPDLAGIDIEGLNEQIEATARAAELLGKIIAPPRNDNQPRQPKLVQIGGRPPAKPSAGSVWVPIVRATGVAEGQFKIVSFGQTNLLICKIGGEFHAYRNACAAGDRPLDEALWESPMLTCACHGYRYDLRRAGACLERPELRLDALPSKVEEERVKVALPEN